MKRLHESIAESKHTFDVRGCSHARPHTVWIVCRRVCGVALCTCGVVFVWFGVVRVLMRGSSQMARDRR